MFRISRIFFNVGNFCCSDKDDTCLQQLHFAVLSLSHHLLPLIRSPQGCVFLCGNVKYVLKAVK